MNKFINEFITKMQTMLAKLCALESRIAKFLFLRVNQHFTGIVFPTWQSFDTIVELRNPIGVNGTAYIAAQFSFAQTFEDLPEIQGSFQLANDDLALFDGTAATNTER